MRKTITIIALSSIILLSGCGKSEPAADPATTAGTPSATAASTGSGVPECDEYLNKVMACIKDKIPQAQRAMMEKGIEDSKKSWAAVSDKAALAQTCKTAMEQAKASYGAVGCTL